MFDFTFQIPTKIIFGRGKETCIGGELKAAGVNRVLFVHGRESIKRTGLFERVADSLDKNNIGYIEFGGVASNPVLSHTREGVEMAKSEQMDAVLAVGGGSVLDESKAIAVGAKAYDDVWNYFIGKEISAALPVFDIMTLAATGSEMNPYAVITNEETKQKYNISSPFVYPRVSILNPELTCTVPLDYSAYGAVDAIAHVIEAYFTKAHMGPRLLDRLVENIIRTIIDTTDIIMQEPDNYEARSEFMWAATLALNGITTAGVQSYSFPNHMMEHSLSALYNIAHGAGLAIIIPAWMKWFAPRNSSQFERFAREVFGVIDVESGIRALEQWFVEIKAPIRFRDAGIPEDEIGRIAENAVGLATRWGIEKTYTRETIADILALAVSAQQ